MKYPLDESAGFAPWLPSTWPEAPVWNDNVDHSISRILRETLVGEIRNVIQDAMRCNGDLTFRGHVVALAMLCAIDALSSYAYRSTGIARCPSCGRGDGVGPRYERFIEQHFPHEYRGHAHAIYASYRNSSVHSWNLFKVRIWADDRSITVEDGVLGFGLLHFFDALRTGVEDFLARLSGEPDLQASVLARYAELRVSARP